MVASHRAGILSALLERPSFPFLHIGRVFVVDAQENPQFVAGERTSKGVNLVGKCE